MNVSNVANESPLSSMNVNPLGLAGGLEDLGKRVLMNMTFPSFQSPGGFPSSLSGDLDNTIGGDGGGISGVGGGGGGSSGVSACAFNLTYRDCLFNVLKGLRELNDTSALTFYEINTLHNRYVFFFCYFMAMCSVCYNPIVYFWMHKKFREEVFTFRTFFSS